MRWWLIPLIALGILGIFVVWPHREPEPKLVKPIAEVTPSKVEMRLLITGDVFWGRGIEYWANRSELGYKWPFSGLKSFNRDQYNAWIGVIECPITDSVLEYQRQVDELKFNCRPEYLRQARKWFDAFTLGSNHTDNMEEIDGFSQTREYLEDSSIQYFGHFDNTISKDICEVISLEADIYDDNKLLIDQQLFPLAFCGFNNVYGLPPEDSMEAITPYAKPFLTIAMPQQGEEYQIAADNLKKKYYRAMVDAGADSVIGGQPHVVQNSEVYEDKLIVYSLGNFIFDQRFDEEVTMGAAIDMQISLDYSEAESWLDIAEECLKFKDKCLKLAESSKPKFNILYNIIAVDASGTVTRKGNKALQQRVEQRTNWDASMDKLGQ